MPALLGEAPAVRQTGDVWCLGPMNSPELMDALRPHWRPRLVDVAWVGEGWRDLVAECRRRLVDRYPSYELHTIEDRDGELRFVASPGPGRDDEAAVAELLTRSWPGPP